MKLRNLTAALIALLTLANAAAEVSMPDAWILKYNECARTVNAPLLSGEMISEQNESVYEFALTESAYLVLYMGQSVQTQGILLETYAGDASARDIFACALSASDGNISVESARNAFNEASRAYQKDVDGEYAFYPYENWVLIFSKGYDDGQYELFSALTGEAYRKMMGEEETFVPDAPDSAPDEKGAQPEEKEGGQTVFPESDKPEEKGKIHKL